MKYLATFFLFFLVSCYRNEECKSFYIGRYKIDKSIISNLECLGYVNKYSWDTVTLISGDDGRYFFDTNDKMLKECEGKWWITSNDTEGNCFGHVKQKNLKTDILGMAFDIRIKIHGQAYCLPFRKIDSAGNFIKPGIINRNP